MNLLENFVGGEFKNGLKWLNESSNWQMQEGILTLVPDKDTDFYRPPNGSTDSIHDNAPFLYLEAKRGFTVTTKISEALLSYWGDAAGITIRSNKDYWAKVCLEKWKTGEIGITSVVTKPEGLSDDCNHTPIDGNAVELRVVRKGNVIDMSYKPQRGDWRFLRKAQYTPKQHNPNNVRVGIHAQVPFEQGHTKAQFSYLEITDKDL